MILICKASLHFPSLSSLVVLGCPWLSWVVLIIVIVVTLVTATAATFAAAVSAAAGGPLGCDEAGPCPCCPLLSLALKPCRFYSLSLQH